MVPRVSDASSDSDIYQTESMLSLGQQLRDISQNNQKLIEEIKNRINGSVVHGYQYSVDYKLLPNVPGENNTELPWAFEAIPLTKSVKSLIEAWEYSGNELHRTVFDEAIDYTLIKYSDVIRLNSDLTDLGAKYVKYFADHPRSRLEVQNTVINLKIVQIAILELRDMTLDSRESIGVTIQEKMKNVTNALKSLSDSMPGLKVSLSAQRYVSSLPSNDSYDNEEKDDKIDTVSFENLELKKRATLCGHSRYVNDMIQYKKDNIPHMASIGKDKNIRLWNIENNESVKKLSGHEKNVNGLAKYEKDGVTYMASASCDKTIKLWNLETEEMITTLTGHSDWVYSLETYEINGTQYLASCSDDETIKIWNLENNSLVSTLKGHASCVYAIKHFQNNSTHYLASGGYDNTIKIWNLNTNALSKTLVDSEHSNCIYKLETYTYKGVIYLLSGHVNGNIKVWNIMNFSLIKTLIGHSSNINGLMTLLYKDEPCLVSCGEGGNIRIWNLKTFELVKEMKEWTNVWSLSSMVIDSKLNMVVGGKSIEFWC